MQRKRLKNFVPIVLPDKMSANAISKMVCCLLNRDGAGYYDRNPRRRFNAEGAC